MEITITNCKEEEKYSFLQENIDKFNFFRIYKAKIAF